MVLTKFLYSTTLPSGAQFVWHRIIMLFRWILVVPYNIILQVLVLNPLSSFWKCPPISFFRDPSLYPFVSVQVQFKSLKIARNWKLHSSISNLRPNQPKNLNALSLTTMGNKKGAEKNLWYVSWCGMLTKISKHWKVAKFLGWPCDSSCSVLIVYLKR